MYTLLLEKTNNTAHYLLRHTFYLALIITNTKTKISPYVIYDALFFKSPS